MMPIDSVASSCQRRLNFWLWQSFGDGVAAWLKASLCGFCDDPGHVVVMLLMSCCLISLVSARGGRSWAWPRSERASARWEGE